MNTAWKGPKYGVISSPYFPVFKINTGKYGPDIDVNLFQRAGIYDSF